MSPLRIATRKSQLALWQAHFIKNSLRSIYPKLDVQLLAMTTAGDQKLDMPLATVGGKGLFVKELEQALLDGRADLAVHSVKDVPVECPQGLMLAVYCEREEPRDALVSNHFASIAELPYQAVVGTASLRRRCLLKVLRPDLSLQILRGNVNTRLQKLDKNEFDAIILAAAGLIRLNMPERIRSILDPADFLPAVGQGVMGIECRAEDYALHQLLQVLDHYPTRQCVLAERALNRHLEGGCQVPIAAYATLSDNLLFLRAIVGRPDGRVILRALGQGHVQDPEALGKQVADDLIQQGAKDILQEVYQMYGA